MALSRTLDPTSDLRMSSEAFHAEAMKHIDCILASSNHVGLQGVLLCCQVRFLFLLLPLSRSSSLADLLSFHLSLIYSTLSSTLDEEVSLSFPRRLSPLSPLCSRFRCHSRLQSRSSSSVSSFLGFFPSSGIWYLTGMAMRQCVEFGYHHETPSASQVSPLEVDMKRRLFWMAYKVRSFSLF